MYQTVGQDAIDHVARALDVPLYRRVIRGSPVEQRAEYGSRDGAAPSSVVGDETEDLYELLRIVIVGVPRMLANKRHLNFSVCRKIIPPSKASLLAPFCRTISASGSSMCQRRNEPRPFPSPYTYLVLQVPTSRPHRNMLSLATGSNGIA
jgi:hypothetical protein